MLIAPVDRSVLVAAYFVDPEALLVLPLTVIVVVVCGTFFGSVLPLTFQRLGLDPALMSNPFVAGLIDIVGIVVYLNIAVALLG